MRTELAADLAAKKPDFVKAFDELKGLCEPGWYPSLWVERRSGVRAEINPKAQNINDKLNEGAVLRVFAGGVLYEEASCEFSLEALNRTAQALVVRVKNEQKSAAASKTSSSSKNTLSWRVPTWVDRLKADLDDELRSQIPGGVKNTDWVHFGTKQKTSLWRDKKGILDHAVSIYTRMQSEDGGVKPDYSLTAVSLDEDHFIFIDEETRLTQSLSRNAVRLVLMKNGERGLVVIGGLGGQETVGITEEHIRSAYRRLDCALKAERLNPGRYPVILSPAVTGVFAHEAFGHTQEGDTWARGRSKARELYEAGQKVGNPLATIVNNPALYKNGTDEFAAWGSYFFDEEGWLAEKHFLVKDGYLESPMTNLTSSVRLNVKRTANAKRESWSHGVYVRQTNTYFTEGDKSFDELVKMVKSGFYAEDSAGGMEDPKGMGIQVGIAYLHEIKDGEFTGRTFKGPSGGAVQMTGFVPECLNSILAKSRIDAFGSSDEGLKHPWNEPGGCAKYHKEVVNAGCGGPFMLVDNVLLG